MPQRFCLDCHKLFDRDTTGTQRCPRCQPAATAARNARGNTTRRGLGHAHRKRVEQELAGIDWCQCTGCGWCGTRGCGQPFTDANPKTGQHVTPRSKGGTDGPLLAYCRSCNSSRGNRWQSQ